MSLEAAIAALTEAVKAQTEATAEQNERLDKMLNKAGATASSGDTEEKPKRTRKQEEEKAETSSDDNNSDDDAGDEPKLTNEGVKQTVAAWLTEFAKNESDPETQARKEKIKATLTAMQKKDGFKVADEKKGATIADVPASELHRVIAWLDKQKTADNGFGEGRLTAVPGAASDDAGEDDEI